MTATDDGCTDDGRTDDVAVVEEREGSHDETGCAEATLQGVHFVKLLLHRMQRVTLRQTFDPEPADASQTPADLLKLLTDADARRLIVDSRLADGVTDALSALPDAPQIWVHGESGGAFADGTVSRWRADALAGSSRRPHRVTRHQGAKR